MPFPRLCAAAAQGWYHKNGTALSSLVFCTPFLLLGLSALSHLNATARLRHSSHARRCHVAAQGQAGRHVPHPAEVRLALQLLSISSTHLFSLDTHMTRHSSPAHIEVRLKHTHHRTHTHGLTPSVAGHRVLRDDVRRGEGPGQAQPHLRTLPRLLAHREAGLRQGQVLEPHLPHPQLRLSSGAQCSLHSLVCAVPDDNVHRHTHTHTHTHTHHCTCLTCGTVHSTHCPRSSLGRRRGRVSRRTRPSRVSRSWRGWSSCWSRT